MFCLDTNVVIAFLKREPRHLSERFTQELKSNSLALPAIALYELQYGVAKSTRREENATRLMIFLEAPIPILTFEPEDAQEAGDIRAHLERAGTPIGPYDILIAAQARRRGALLVTANSNEFERVPGLRTENWAAA